MVTLFRQQQPQNTMVRQLASSLMQAPSTPAYGTAGALVNFGRPIVGALLERQEAAREKREREAESSALGRALLAANEARQSGQDPMAAASAFFASNEGQPGMAAASDAFNRLNVEMLARNMIGTPGRDVPYSPEVEEQMARIAQAKAKPPQPPSDVREYEYAVEQGYPGSFQDYQVEMANAAAPRAPQPAPPAGFRFAYDDEGRPVAAIPIPGGPAAQEMEASAEARLQKERREQREAQIVIKDIQRIRQITQDAKIPVTGKGSILAVWPGTKARNVRNLLDAVKANVGFSKLQALRDASPTGGAVGQVSEMENRLMQSALGSLEQSLTKEEFLYNLGRVEQLMWEIVEGVHSPNRQGGMSAEYTPGPPGTVAPPVGSAPPAEGSPVVGASVTGRPAEGGLTVAIPGRERVLDAIPQMDLATLSQLDPNTLTPEEREAAAKRWDELNAR